MHLSHAIVCQKQPSGELGTHTCLRQRPLAPGHTILAQSEVRDSEGSVPVTLSPPPPSPPSLPAGRRAIATTCCAVMTQQNCTMH